MRRLVWAKAPPAARQSAKRKAARQAACLMVSPVEFRWRSFKLESDHPHQPVGPRREAFQPVDMGDQHLRVVEVGQRALGEKSGGDLLIDSLALGRVAGGTRLQVPGVDLLVAIMAEILRRAAGL